LNQQRREYDEYLAYTDAEFGRLYDGMAQSGVLDNTCVVVTSDHGELFERGIRGHVTPVLYEPVVHIPLLITTPGQTQREDIYTPTNCVDVLPTLLGIAGQPPPVWCEGEVIPLVARSQPDNKRALYAMEAKGNPKHAPLTKATVALFKGQHKLVRYSGYENYDLAYELYDLDKDPEEQENLDSLEEPLGLQMREELEQKLDEVNHAHAGKGS
jgi:arylsulfatase A-like enzyme